MTGFKEKILDERAKRLKDIQKKDFVQSGEHYLVFIINPDVFAIHVSHLLEVGKYQELFHVPLLPEYIHGVIFRSGKIIPVINIKTYFELRTPGLTSSDYIIFIEADGLIFGLLADRIKGLFTFSDEELVMNRELSLPKEIKGYFQNDIALLSIENIAMKLRDISF